MTARLNDTVVYTGGGPVYHLVDINTARSDNNGMGDSLYIAIMEGPYSYKLPLNSLCARILYQTGMTK